LEGKPIGLRVPTLFASVREVDFNLKVNYSFPRGSLLSLKSSRETRRSNLTDEIDTFSGKVV